MKEIRSNTKALAALVWDYPLRPGTLSVGATAYLVVGGFAVPDAGGGLIPTAKGIKRYDLGVRGK